MVEEKLVNFRLNAELYQQLKILSVRENRKIKDILREEIENYCKVHKEGNPQHLITKYQENEDFVGFPAIAIALERKRNYVETHCQNDGKLNEFGQGLWFNVVEWYNILKQF